MLDSVFDFFSALGFAVIAIFGINVGTDEPAYEVVERIGDGIEIRCYPPRNAAETTVDASKSDNPSGEAFRILAGYIFGGNKVRRKIAMTAPVEIDRPGEKIAMTAPVEMTVSSGVMTMRFFMPSHHALGDLPEPDDPRVKLMVIPATTVAVITFSGLSDKINQPEESQLRIALRDTQWIMTGPATAYYYNPPWTLPFLRTNEVVIPVRR
ncbi:SOUL family heme-binding protein [Telmatospirillum siberiense]|uniref:Heme-binding protein n=1 Tax=Telmatospirillum siberiense TaxID=382514 RepID=A0A2N3PTE0_9PROT|nr:heme-binding protein [Telmatospirillum siberiense]PKU23671.1 heme-binding protein [Telmatospirillum siberiense]